MNQPPRPKVEKVEKRSSVVKHIADMKEEEREKILGDDEKARASYEMCIKNDLYNCKRDRCKEMRDCKEHEEKEKEERLETLTHHNQELTQLSEAQTAKINELQAVIIQHNELLAKIVARLPPG